MLMFRLHHETKQIDLICGIITKVLTLLIC